MNFDVVYVPSAEAQLAAIWVNAPDQADVSRASDRIDRLLGSDPLTAGESRPPGRRGAIELPLVVYYEVSEPDRRVRVLPVIGAGTRS